MIGSKWTSRLKGFYNIFMKPPMRWRLPKKSQILIYDGSGAALLKSYMTQYSVETLYLRGELVNMPCLLFACMKSQFWKGRPLQAYCDAFISAVNPCVVVTFIDNNPNFYKVSQAFPGTKTVFVQNGMRDAFSDIFASITRLERNRVDYMLVFNNEIGKKYREYISGQAIAVGSAKNNFKEMLDNPLPNSILFVSQFRQRNPNDDVFVVGPDNTQISWDQFYASDRCVLKFLDRWCVENNKLLRVAGSMNGKENPEQEFFATHLEKCRWQYVPRTGDFGSYELVDQSEMVVFVDSTLGFESIGRGKKTAAFSCRGSFLNDQSLKFGWPAQLPDNGSFWTNIPDEKDFQRVMDYLNSIDAEEWERVRRQHKDQLMEFDPGNTRFVALLGRLLPDTIDSTETQ